MTYGSTVSSSPNPYIITPLDLVNASVGQGTWVLTDNGAAGAVFAYSIYNASADINDNLTWTIPMARGTYVVDWGRRTLTNAGKAYLYVDNVLVSICDCYGSDVQNVHFISYEEFSLSYSGFHTVKIAIESKNASSSDYAFVLNSLAFIKMRDDFHQGNWDGSLFDARRYPWANAITRSGWTYTKGGGDISSQSIVAGGVAILLALTAADVGTKYMQYSKPTITDIAKDSVFEIKDKFRYTAIATSYAANFGLFNSATASYRTTTNSIISFIDANGKPYFDVWDSTRTYDRVTGSNSDIAINTDYWRTIKGTGTLLTCDFYSTEELQTAGGNGDIRHLEINVSDVGGTVTCNRVGWMNADGGGGSNGTQNIYMYKITSTCNKWYYDVQ